MQELENMRDGIRIKGKLRLEARNRHTGLIEHTIEQANTIMYIGLLWLAEHLAPETSVGVTYCALGDDGTATDPVDIALNSEVARLAVTQATAASTGSPPTVTSTISTFFLASQCTYHIREVGMFAGPDASSTPDSGDILSRGLIDFDNSAGDYDITATWVYTISS